MRLLFRWLTREKLELLYIGGCEVLPEPLNAREEQACIEAMQDHQDKEAKEKLIAHNLRLVVYIAKKFDNTKVGTEDLISIGTIGLMKAINTFDASKSIKPWRPMRRAVLKMRSLCICVKITSRNWRFRLMNLSMWTGMEMNFFCRIF